MWSSILGSITGLFTSWMDTKRAKHKAEIAMHMQLAKAEADWDLVAQRQAQYSWKDEFITFVWFAPLIVAWWEPDKAQEWVQFVSELPYFYQFGMFGIIAASFGLRWYFKQQGFKIGGDK